MTLKEWCDKAGVKPTHPTTERQATSVLSSPTSERRAELWSISDHAVSSVSGPVVWLVPKS